MLFNPKDRLSLPFTLEQCPIRSITQSRLPCGFFLSLSVFYTASCLTCLNIQETVRNFSIYSEAESNVNNKRGKKLFAQSLTRPLFQSRISCYSTRSGGSSKMLDLTFPLNTADTQLHPCTPSCVCVCVCLPLGHSLYLNYRATHTPTILF